MEIKNKFIVSCQALSDEPLHSDMIMAKMAKAAEQGGAGAIRANSIKDIRAIKNEVTLPIIGIIKKIYTNSEIHITPTYLEVEALINEGCDIVAMDCTSRVRPKESLEEIIQKVKRDYPGQLLMADCSCIKDVQMAINLGFDIIASTLVGYTKETADIRIDDNDFSLLKEMIRLCHAQNKQFYAEGNIDTPKKARRTLECGADGVVVGSMITRPQLITKRYVEAIKGD